MTYLPEFLTVAVIHLLAVISPGPDFILVSRNSLIYSRKTAIYTAVGLSLGILVHVAYSLVGIALIISKSILIFSIIKYLGAAYLIYIGINSLRAKSISLEELNKDSRVDLTPARAVKMGFLTNVLNPKATLFFLALFTQVINPQTPVIVQLLYGIEMSVMTFIWFGIVGTALSHHAIRGRFSRVQHHFEHLFGAILIALGIKVSFA
jgi:RhtB (resistance to homoserine/threonine) family protein